MAPAAIKDLLTAFSSNGDLLAICSGDGRVKIWDTISGSLKGDFADIAASSSETVGQADGHLAVDYSCMAWSPLVRKAKKKSGGHGSSFLLGLGTGSGDVLLLDTALGQLKWRIQDCHSGGVKSLTFAKSGSIMYTAGADGNVCELDIDSGELLNKFRASKRAISCVAVSGDGSFLAAGSAEIKLFDLISKKRLCKFTGHPDAVKAIVFSGDHQHLISSAVGERHVAVWQVDGTKKGSAAACFLSMEHPAISLHCSGELSESLRVLAISEAGAAYVWYASSIEELSKAKPVKISVLHSKGEISPASKSLKSSRPAVFAGQLLGKSETGPGSVMIAHGTTVKPIFEQISLVGQGTNILLQANEDGILLPASQSASAVQNRGLQAANIKGPDNAVDATQPRTIVEQESTPLVNKQSSHKKRRATTESPLDEGQTVDVDRIKASDAVQGVLDASVDEYEETMEEKLKALGIIEETATDEVERDHDHATPVKADSLQVLMTQALQSDDKALLEQCLHVTDEKIIAKTIGMLNPLDAAKFLQLSIFKVDSRTNRGLLLVPWIKAVLLYHASYIMSNPSLQPILSSLYQAIDARLSVFRPLLSLSGRLDLLMAQVSANKLDKQEEMAAAVVYDESEEDVEDVMEVDTAEEGGSDDSDDNVVLENGGIKGKDSDVDSEQSMEDSDND